MPQPPLVAPGRLGGRLDGTRPWRSLALLVVLALLLGAGALAVTALLTGQAEREQLGKAGAEAGLAAGYVGEQQLGLLDVVAGWADRADTIELASTGTGRLPPAQRRRANLLVASLRQARPDLGAAFLTDVDGRTLANAPVFEPAIGKSFADREWFRGVVATGRPYTTSAYRSILPGMPWFVASAAPVRGQDGALVGVVVATYPLTKLQTYADDYAASYSGRLSVIDATGQVLASSGRPARGDELARDRAGSRLTGGVRRLPDGVLDSTSGGPQDLLVAASTVPDLGWSVVVSRPARTALAGTGPTIWAVWACAAAVWLAFALGWGAWWRVAGRRRAALAVVEGRFRAVVTASPAGIVTLDLQQRIAHSNAAFAQMVGLSPQEVLGRHGYDFFHPDSSAPDVGAVQELVEGVRTAYSAQRLLRQADGAPLAVKLDFSVITDAAGEVVELACVVTDVSRQAAAHAELQRAKERAEVLWAKAPVGVIEGTPDGTITAVNGAMAAMLGYGPEDLLGTPATRLADPAFRPEIEVARVGLLNGQTYTAERRYLAADGRSVPVHVSTAVLHDGAGEVSRIAGFVVDMTEVHQQQAALRSAVERLGEAQRLGRLGSFTYDLSTGQMHSSQELHRIWGVEELQPDEDGLFGMIHPDDRPGVAERWAAAQQEGGVHTEAYRITRPDGALRHLRVVVEVAKVDGVTVAVHGTHLDVTDLTVAQREADTANAFFTAVLTATPDPTFVTDVATGEVRYCSPGKELLGVTSETLGAMDPDVALGLVHPEDRTRVQALAVAAGSLRDGELLQLRYRALSSDGSWRWLSRRTTPLRRDPVTGDVLEVVDVLRDVTEMVQNEERLTFAALHDPLTGLPNRSLLMTRLEDSLARATATGAEIAVLCCDLDGFKRVNDRAGHAAGDTLLVAIGDRLSSALRAQDTVARVGGDEFVLLVEPWHRDPDHAVLDVRALATNLAERLAAAVRRPVVIDGVEHVVSASIGISYAGGALDADQVLQDADAAMYRAKQRGKDRYEVFAPSLRAGLERRGEVEHVLRQALSRTASCALPVPRGPAQPSLWPAYQPVVDAATGALVGFEALARLRDADGTSIAPDEFIVVAEETGLIRGLGALMLDRACRQLADWRAELPAVDGVTMAVNVSGLQAQRADLGEDVRHALRAHGLVGADLILELTETALLEASASTLTALQSLRAEGVGIAIDDFGTGYASLRYLATLPVSAVKVDRSFTSGLPHDQTSYKIVHAVAGLAADLGLDCVVEGVETEEQRRALPSGVHLQGWLTGRPAAASDLDVLRLVLSEHPAA